MLQFSTMLEVSLTSFIFAVVRPQNLQMESSSFIPGSQGKYFFVLRMILH